MPVVLKEGFDENWQIKVVIVNTKNNPMAVTFMIKKLGYVN